MTVISETTARRFFPSGDALGQVLRIQAEQWRMVGVIADIVDRKLDGERKPFCWVPFVFNSGRMSFAVRTAGVPLNLVGSVRRELAALNPGVALANPRSLDVTRAGSLTQRKVVLGLVSAFAGAALLLACVGIYGVMAYGVATRRREIGIRLALGAVPMAMVGQVLAGGIRSLVDRTGAGHTRRTGRGAVAGKRALWRQRVRSGRCCAVTALTIGCGRHGCVPASGLARDPVRPAGVAAGGIGGAVAVIPTSARCVTSHFPPAAPSRAPSRGP